jgi:polyisoprenoid-binding protein YceI
MVSRLKVMALGAAAALMLVGAAGSQQMPTPQHDYKAAPAGKYAIDPKHTALIARIPHLGFSYSMFRFQSVDGKLSWDPANPGADSLSVSVDPKSITTAPVEGFSGEIASKYLKAAQFPTATFTSTAFHAEGPTRGKVDGDLTIAGVTKHVVFDVELVGAGKFFGKQVIGVTARTELDPKAYGLPAFMNPIQLTIDSEFDG